MQRLAVVILGSGMAFAQLPLNYDVENRGDNLSVTAGALVRNSKLPDPFALANGSRVASQEDWILRRNEIKADIEKYEIGAKPRRPADITASYSGGTLTVTVKEGGRTVTLTSRFSIPSGTGPHPIIIGMNSGTGSLSSSLFDGVVQVPFNHDQVATYSMSGGKDLNAPFYKTYTNLSTAGDYDAWSWGVSRLIDGLELIADQQNLDMGRIAVTGCSYAGKMALFAGAFDERVTLTIAQESGGGGINSWRTSDAYAKRVEDIEKINNTSSTWFMQSMLRQDPYMLPHDHHELIAMIAPRAVLALGNPDYTWLGDESGYKSAMAALEVWKAMDIEDRFGFDFTGGHSHCQAATNQNNSVTAFVDKFLRGKTSANTTIRTKPNKAGFDLDYTSWIDWTTPTIKSDPNAPKVALTSPTVLTFEEGATITLQATATDVNGTITKVEFYNGNTLLASLASAPYSHEWKDVAQGTYQIRAVATDSEGKTGQDGKTIQVTKAQGPYGGTAWAIPGAIELEDYDEGGAGSAYQDGTPGSETGVTYRAGEDVDLEQCMDAGGGYNIGWATTGEWLEYTVDVKTSGTYTMTLRAACDGTGRTVSLTSDGGSLAQDIAIPNTGGWQTWTYVTVNGLALDAGKHVLRLTIGSADYVNLNSMSFTLDQETKIRAFRNEPGISASLQGDRLQILGAPSGARARLYDLSGRLMVRLGAAGGLLPPERPGICLVQVTTSTGRLLFTQAIHP